MARVHESVSLAQHRVQRHFAEHRAMAPADAIEYAPPGPQERKAFDLLRAQGVIRQTMPAYYWFDLDPIGQERRPRRNRKTPVAIALAIMLGCLAIMLYRA